jgi:WbqC-like protein family
MRRASDLVPRGLASSELLSAVVVAAGGDTYVSGPTGRSYMDEEVFAAHGVRVEYRAFVPFVYEQRCAGFEPGLSALDLLFNDPNAQEAWRSHGSDG